MCARTTAAHVFHSWSAQDLVTPLPIAGAAGSYVWDYEGRRYLDFSSQLVYTNIGHQHPKVVSAIQAQAARLCTVGPQFANDVRGEAARLVAAIAPGDLNKVFFTNGGAEAIEHATRLARLHTGRIKVLASYRSYHGATTTAINLTGDPRRWENDYGSAGVVHFFGPFLYRSPFHSATEEEECVRALEHLEQVVQFEGPSNVAAIVLETVPGTAGIMVPPPGYLAGVRELCDRYRIVFVADEVMCGFGRTGRWLAIDHWAVRPDLITFAKGVNSGYVPLGGVMISDRIAATFAERPYPGGLTYSGHPLACAAAVASMNAMREERIVENAARDRRGGARTGSSQTRGTPPVDRRGARPRRLLGARAREGPRDERTCGPLRRDVTGDKRARRGMPRSWTPAVHELQPAARRAALHGQRGRGERGPRDPRRSVANGRRPLRGPIGQVVECRQVCELGIDTKESGMQVAPTDETKMSEHEVEQVERANASSRVPVVLIHGLWALPSCWDRWRELLKKPAMSR